MDVPNLANVLKTTYFLAALTGYICWAGILWFLIRFVQALRREWKKRKTPKSGTLANLAKLWRD